jgi:phenylacetate-CoA ligase
LEALPLTTSADLKSRSHTDFLAVPSAEVHRYHQSFGTTGGAVCGWYTVEDLEAEVPIVDRWIDDLGPGSMLLNRYPYSFPVPNALVEAATRIQGGCVIPAGSANFNVSYIRALKLMEERQVTAVAALPWEPLFLAETARLLGQDPAKDFPHLRTWMLAGSLVPPRMRELIEQTWSCQVRILYGSTEAGPMATSCERGAMHLHDDDFVFEVVHGVLVATSLRRRAQPMVRYSTGDAIRLTGQPCACGGRGRVVEILGRKTGALRLGERDWSDLDFQETALACLAPYRSAVWFCIATRRGLTVRVETRQPRRDRRAVQRALAEALGCRVRLLLHAPGALINHGALLSGWNVYKPRVVSDWRRAGERRIINWSGAVVDWWGQLGLGLVIGAIRKSIADRLLSWKLRLLG